MAVDLDNPYHDEPLFGVVARYMGQVKVGHKGRFLRGLFGFLPRIPITVAYGLKRVAAETANVWGLSSGELAERLTLFPYYAAMLPDSMVHSLRAGMDQKARKPSPLIVQSKLRYCDTCRAEDRIAGRPEYWRRSHQLPGVLLCPEHRQWLTEIPFESRHFQSAWPALQELGRIATYPVDLSLDASEFEACIRVARASVWLLHNRVTVNISWLINLFKDIAWDAGYTYGRQDVACRRLTDDFIGFYGERYLSHIGALPQIGDNNWLGTVVRGGLPRRYTSRVLLAAIFMATVCDSSSNVAWPVCPNLFATHGPGHVVDGRVRKGERYSATCSCGFKFTYSGTENRIPMSVRPTFYGHTHADFARKLHAEGASRRDIAVAMGISEHSVSSLIKGR